MTTKQVILVRKDLNMPLGKLMVQVAHASLTAIINLMSSTEGQEDASEDYPIFRELCTYSNSSLNIWLTGEQKKICLQVESEEELNHYYELALKLKLPCSYIIDNGHTVFNNVKTPTAVAIGPAFSEKIDEITKHLKLYK